MRRALVVGLLLSMGAPAAAREALGTAPVVSGDEATARRRAVDEALRQLVDQAVAELVPAPERTRADAVIQAKIIRRARAYVTRHAVLEERVEPTGSVSVRIDGEIAKETLVRDLGALGVQVPGAQIPTVVPTAKPRVLIGIPGAGGGAIGEALAGVGLEASASATPLEDDARGVEAARGSRATAAIVGTLRESAPEPIRGTGLTSVSVELEARAVDAGAGQAVGSVKASESGWGDTPAAAADRAARRAGAKLGPALAKALRPVQASAELEIVVAGVSRWADVADVVRVASALPEVAAVVPSRAAVHLIALGVRGKITPQALAQAIGRGLGPAVIVSARGGKVVVDRVAGGAEGEGGTVVPPPR